MVGSRELEWAVRREAEGWRARKSGKRASWRVGGGLWPDWEVLGNGRMPFVWSRMDLRYSMDWEGVK